MTVERDSVANYIDAIVKSQLAGLTAKLTQMNDEIIELHERVAELTGRLDINDTEHTDYESRISVLEE